MTVHEFLRRAHVRYIVSAVLVPVGFIVLMLTVPTAAVLSLLIAFPFMMIASVLFHEVLPRCPRCRQNVFGRSCWERERWWFMTTTTLERLVPTRCRCCGADLQSIPYRRGFCGIPKAESTN